MATNLRDGRATTRRRHRRNRVWPRLALPGRRAPRPRLFGRQRLFVHPGTGPGSFPAWGRFLGRRHGGPHDTFAPPVLVVAVVGFTVFAVALATVASRSPSSPAQACPGDGLIVVAAPDIAGPLSDLASAYAATPGQVCSRVAVVARPTSLVVDSFLRGWDESVDGPLPDVWIPESSLWPRVIEASLTSDAQAAADSAAAKASASPPVPPDGADPALNSLPSESGPSVAYSPLVVALPELVAIDLGWSVAPPRWAELVSLLTAPDGWGAQGRPEWGRPSLAVADPASATVGLQAVVALAGAARGLELEEYLPAVTSSDPAVVGRLDMVRAGVAVTGAAGPGLLADADARADAGQMTMYLVGERDVLEHNQTAGSRLVAVYPADGTPLSDYPYLLVGKDQMAAANRSAAAAFFGFLERPATRDRLVGDGFRRSTASEGPPFNATNGLAAAPSRPLLPATGGGVLTGLVTAWNNGSG